jgi:hypothetical protein
MSRQKDILDELSKDELLGWVRTQFYRLPKRSDILYIRWEKQSGDLLAAMEAENRSLDGIDFAERDRLARQVNESTCSKEKLRLIHLMAPYGEAMMAHIKRSQALTAKQAKVDKLYEQIDIERQKESRSTERNPAHAHD